MDNGHKILSGFLAIAIIIIVLMRSCGNKPINDSAEMTISIDTVRHETVYDTTWHDTTTFTYITVETPKIKYVTEYIYDTISLPTYSEEDFDEMMRHPAVYEDTRIQDDTVHLYYKATVRGYLDKIKLGYKIVKPFLIESNTIIETEITKVKRPISFYMGLDVGANASGPTYFAPMAEIVAPKMSYNAGFDIINKSIVIGVKSRISFRRKTKIIPRP